MFEMLWSLVEIQEREKRVRGDSVPRLSDVRRVPVRYHRVLPLSVVKRYRCVVLGASRNALTVGIIECDNTALLDFLQVLTGTTVFPVLVEPKVMSLLIKRLERSQHIRYRSRQAYYALQLPAQVRLILDFRGRVRERSY